MTEIRDKKQAMRKIIIKKIIKKLNLLPLTEQFIFLLQKYKNKRSNLLFKKENPEVKLPPDFYMYETFALNYKKFYTNGIPTAQWLLNHIEEFIELKNVAVLDWGCGTGRLLRHLPTLMDTSNTFFGTDYNKKYIKWCSDNLEGICFKNNELNPPLDFEDNSLDVIYGISIFTHLSESLHYSWMKELTRVLRNNGIIFLTTHGDAHMFKLLEKEQEKYNQGELVVHSYKKEGNRLFASYQSPVFFKKLCEENNLKILKHIPGNTKNRKPQQDVWVLQGAN